MKNKWMAMLIMFAIACVPVMTSCGDDEPSGGNGTGTGGSGTGTGGSGTGTGGSGTGNNSGTAYAVTYTVNGVSFKMVPVQGGTFIMGGISVNGEAISDRELPRHRVTLSSYNIGETEVTQALWVAVMGSNPSKCNGHSRPPQPPYDYGTNLQRPVDNVSWDDCQVFITQLNQLTGKTFRLPTEAEWEYAARGGSQSRGYEYSGSNNIDDVGWYNGNVLDVACLLIGPFDRAAPGTQTVATKAPNELGLYDMSGNVTEWCQDWYYPYNYLGLDEFNPTGPATRPDVSDARHVSRGGAHDGDLYNCRVSCRHGDGQKGLRLAL